MTNEEKETVIKIAWRNFPRYYNRWPDLGPPFIRIAVVPPPEIRCVATEDILNDTITVSYVTFDYIKLFSKDWGCDQPRYIIYGEYEGHAIQVSGPPYNRLQE